MPFTSVGIGHQEFCVRVHVLRLGERLISHVCHGCRLGNFGGQGLCLQQEFPSGSDSKETACKAGDLGSIPGSGRSPGEGNGNPLQYCLENSMDRGAWQAPFHGVAVLDTTE